MTRHLIVIATATLVLLDVKPARADAAPPGCGGCGGGGGGVSLPACNSVARSQATGKSCQEADLGSSAATTLKQSGYQLECERPLDGGHTKQVWCKATASGARTRAIPLAGAFLFAGLWWGTRLVRRRR
jgi:hypothetical protein